MIERLAGFIYDLGGRFALGFVGAFVGVVVTGGVLVALTWLTGNETIAVGILVLVAAVTLVMLAPRTRALLGRRRTHGRPTLRQLTAGAPRYLLGLLLDALGTFGASAVAVTSILLVYDDRWGGRFWLFAIVGSTVGILVQRTARWIARRTGFAITEHDNVERVGLDPAMRDDLSRSQH